MGPAVSGAVRHESEARGGDPAAETIHDAWFDSPVCHNCGAALTTAFCSQCGQKKAARLALGDMGREAWDRLRLFELASVRTLGRLLVGPGNVARDYVMGRRKQLMNPLTLLVALVAVLVLVLAANRYFQHFDAAGGDRELSQMASRVLAYANWSFSLGIIAIFVGSWTVFGRRRGHNPVEHAVLSIYCQCLILAIIIVNMVPTLVWRSPDFILWHKWASQYYLYAIKLAVVAAAYKQFFRLNLRTDWPRLLAACLIYLVTSWLLLRVYAAAVLWLVTRTA